jgi:hypothetical protein
MKHDKVMEWNTCCCQFSMKNEFARAKRFVLEHMMLELKENNNRIYVDENRRSRNQMMRSITDSYLVVSDSTPIS